MPVMFLTTATICMIFGMFLHVWSATRHLDHASWWGPDSKVCCRSSPCVELLIVDGRQVALTFTIVAIISIVIFFTGQVTLYAPQEDSD